MQPAAYLKILALLVPKEMEVTHKGGVKAMTDEQLEQGIEAIRAMLAAREAGSRRFPNLRRFRRCLRRLAPSISGRSNSSVLLRRR
jgi:hypothetical protein